MKPGEVVPAIDALLLARVELLVSVLRGVRDMALTEAAHGSEAWSQAVVLIDKALAEDLLDDQ